MAFSLLQTGRMHRRVAISTSLSKVTDRKESPSLNHAGISRSTNESKCRLKGFERCNTIMGFAHLQHIRARRAHTDWPNILRNVEAQSDEHTEDYMYENADHYPQVISRGHAMFDDKLYTRTYA